MTQNERLTEAQRAAVLEWVAAGLQSGEINKRGAEFTPPFHLSRQTIDYYRKSLHVKIEEIKHENDNNALTTGLALRENRVQALKRLAELLEKDVVTGPNLWVTDVKAVGFEKVYIERFNSSEVDQLRGVYDDIAKEMGERTATSKSDINLNGELNVNVALEHYLAAARKVYGNPKPG